MPLTGGQKNQLALQRTQTASLLDTFTSTLRTSVPYDSIVDFATHPDFCGANLYPRQLTALKLIYLETENMTAYDLMVIEEWMKGFGGDYSVGTPSDVWDRITALKKEGWRHFPHVVNVTGRRGSKGVIGGFCGAEQIAFMICQGDPQAKFGLRSRQVYLNVTATNLIQAKKAQFADIRTTVESCKFLQKYISTNNEHLMTFMTPGDILRLAELTANGVPQEGEMASIVAWALSSQSNSTRGIAAFATFYDEFGHMLQGTGGPRTAEELYNCLAGDTKIYMSDGSWKPISEVEPGDMVRSLNREYGGDSIIDTEVVAKWPTEDREVFEIEMEDGTVVKCSGNHPWLTQRGWVRTDELTEEDEILQESDFS